MTAGKHDKDRTMATVSLKKDKIEAIRYAADLLRTAAEGADQDVYD
jgi:hypothetical protein